MWRQQYNFDTSGKSDCTPLKITSSISTLIFFSFLVSGLLACNSKANRVNVWLSFVKWNKTGPKRTGWFLESFPIVSCFGNMSQLPTSCKDYTWYQNQELKYFDVCGKILQHLQLVFRWKGKRNNTMSSPTSPTSFGSLSLRLFRFTFYSWQMFLAQNFLQSIKFFPFLMFSVTFLFMD